MSWNNFLNKKIPLLHLMTTQQVTVICLKDKIKIIYKLCSASHKLALEWE